MEWDTGGGMEKTAEKKLAAGLSFMGRPLGELLELKASCRKRLEFLDANRGRISEYVYNKLRQEYNCIPGCGRR